MSQLGHTGPRFTLRVYTHLMSRREGERQRLEALVKGVDWALMGTNWPERPFSDPSAHPEEPRKDDSFAGDSGDGRGWFRTSDLSRVKRALSH